jgi:hypothetical protein
MDAMTPNETADRLAALTAALLLVVTAWGNGVAMLVTAFSTLVGLAIFYARFGRGLSRTALGTVLAAVLVSAAFAVIAWKVKL